MAKAQATEQVQAQAPINEAELALTRTRLAKLVKEKTGHTYKVTDEILAAAIEEIVSSLQSGRRVRLDSLGSFVVKHYNATTRPNPQDRSKTVNVPARNRAVFKPCKELRDRVRAGI